MKKILSIENPPITSYPSIANVLSILWCHKEEVIPWLCDHYIQLVVRNTEYKNDWLNFYDNIVINNIDPVLNCPFIDFQLIDKKANLNGSKSFTDFIEMQINNGYYIDTCLNQYFFSFSDFYMKKEYIHPTFIYGYDNKEKLIYVSDFFNNGKYSSQKVSYDEINKSYRLDNMQDIEYWRYWVTLYKYNNKQYNFNLKLFKLCLNDYIKSKDSFFKLQYSFRSSEDKMYFGLQCYDLLTEHVKKFKTQLSLRSIHIFYDHKIAMLMRLDYIEKEHLLIFNTYSVLKRDFNYLADLALRLRNSALKYVISKDEELLSHIVELIQELKRAEQKILVNLLESII